MGFSPNLQSRAGHEALLCRQDAELRLLETMRRCLSSKVKCDRDYCTALSAITTQGQKVERGDEGYLTGSLVAQAWKGILEEVENAAKLVKTNADVVEKETLEKLNTLYIEKRKARKSYQDDHIRISLQMSNIAEDVTKKKAEYQKQLENYRLMRSRFEEHYVKSSSKDEDRISSHRAAFCGISGRGGRKLDDVRDKYQRACRKLHLVHNEYVLLLVEAEENEKHFRTSLLPALLHQHQANQELFVKSWRNIMREISRLWNFASREFAEINSRVEAHVESIKPAEEYKDFSERHKSLPTEAVRFTFDSTLVEDTSGKLQPNQLTVDNLTIESVQAKMADLESRLKEVKERKALCNQESSELTINGLMCEECLLSRQLDVIHKAFNELGCEEPPVGCDLPLDHSFENGNIADNQLNDVSPMKRSSLPHQTQSSTNSLVDMLRKPFRRKSVPSSPTARRPSVPISGVGCDNDLVISNLEPQPTSLIVPDLSLTHSVSLHSLNMIGSTRSLVEEEWFHGVLPREEVVRLLTREGDFLVRETTRNAEHEMVLSVCWGGFSRHFIVQTTQEGHYRFEGPAFATVQELIMYQWQSGLPVTSRSGAILRQPIARELWELNNDDVLLLDKIGRGNFGDVYKARLRTTGQEVAVKTCRVTVPDEHKRKFLQEGRILKQYDHPNIVKLIGICVQKQPIMIVMELVVGGSLLTFLRNNSSSLTQKQLLFMCRDTAAGMRYLESKNCIHRDLAARNCLVGADNVVKISDFGMSREEEEYIVSDGMKQIPIKWTAPEALNFGKYTSLCDVWSYGVLMWEIFAKGGTPYPGYSNSKAREKIDQGYRMPAPEGTPDEIYQLMLCCWEYQPENRPHFDRIFTIVEKICYGST
ncbi:tyrosine-protein kinase Fer isoform X2 [Macrosteles quadrilineatus]|uniref:tyrosine-protein kinase Fer isoform X2 n=1 Tax=Macrosteles quadrilineatus TaxID=74068 RepID=UPI0023E2A4EE|nr:tyrosine-protein kinase Fer isoform X2 [Macrosteles quadrilineatus]